MWDIVTSGWTRSPGYCILIALCAATLGSIAGTALYLGAGGLHAPSLAALAFLPGVFLVAAFAMIFAVPGSLIVGAPLLWLGQELVRRWPIPATIALALIGMFLGIELHDRLDRGSLHPDQYLSAMTLFGATVAAAHPILLYHRWRRSWPRTLLVVAISGLVLTIVGRMTLDRIEAGKARAQYAAECRADSGVYFTTPIARPSRESESIRAREPWSSDRQSARLHNYAALLVDGKRVLVINDVALAPVTLRSRLTGTRRIERHCLATRQDAYAQRARAAGLVTAPPTQWPDDRNWW